MKKRKMIVIYALVLSLVIGAAFWGSRAVTVFTEEAPFTSQNTVIIDAGHGEPDGGTTSYTGVKESTINLEIALRLEDLMHLLGMNTIMVRKTTESVYTEGDSIAKKKISDLKNRVSLVNNTPNATLVSIHQNYFSDSKYCGAQVFYNNISTSRELAANLQRDLISSINPNSKRQPKKGSGIYLLEKINCTGILVECGFLSNPQEEYKLRTEEYQKKICCVIASSLCNYLNA